MFKTLILLALFTIASCDKPKYVDPFAALDRHISHAFSYHYLWPWNQLIKAAAMLDGESFDEPQIASDEEKLVVRMNVKNFKPEELKVRVKNRNIIVEGKQKVDNDNRFIANQFVQRFVLPLGSKQEEVSAVLNEKGILVVSVPRHEVPPPPPEREVPIEVLLPTKEEKLPEKPEEIPEKKTEKPKKPTEVTKATESPTKVADKVELGDDSTEKKEEPIQTSTATPLEQLELVEATTHVGKIRKKELKENKTSKDNEVTKSVENNGLEYTLDNSE